MSRSIARASCRRRAHEFEGSDIVGHALDALDRSAIRTVTILGRRGPHQIAMTPKELGELGHLEAALPVVEPADFPPRRGRRCARAGPAQVGHAPARLRRPRRRTSPSAWSSISSPSRVAIEGDGKAERIIVERTELDESGGGARHRRDLRSPGIADRQLRSAIRRRRSPACPMTTRRQVRQRRRPDRRPALCRRLGAARADRDHRHQPARRL